MFEILQGELFCGELDRRCVAASLVMLRSCICRVLFGACTQIGNSRRGGPQSSAGGKAISSAVFFRRSVFFRFFGGAEARVSSPSPPTSPFP